MSGGKKEVFGAASAALFALLAASGCGSVSTYRPQPEDGRDLTPVAARALLIKTGETVSGCHLPITSGMATYESFAPGCGKPARYRYADHPALVAMTYVADPVEGHGADKNCINPTESSIHRGSGTGRWNYNECLFYSSGAHAEAARDFVRAWVVLARDGAAFQRTRDESFELAAKSYREAAEKPALPESAVRFKVQAEAAVKEKRFGDAADLYEQGLDAAPWWPAGRYNRGLILGELKDYEEANRELRRYLQLEPDAANSRAVQLKIYEWEALVPKAAQ